MKVDPKPWTPSDEAQADALWQHFRNLTAQDRAAFLAGMIARSVKRVP